MQTRIAALALVALVPALSPATETSVERGRYLSQLMLCGDCHTPRLPDGAFDTARWMAGSDVGFEVPGLGIFWPPNLTNHETGLKAWSDEEIATALREGRRPDGRELAPIMPWHFFKVIEDEDLDDLIAFIRSLEGVDHTVPAPVGPQGPALAPYLGLIVPQKRVSADQLSGD